MCLMKPNYDVVKHLEYQRKIMVKWVQELTEWTDLNTDIMTEDAYLHLMNHYKGIYEGHSHPKYMMISIERLGIKRVCNSIEELFDNLEHLYESMKAVDKNRDDYKPISYDNKTEEWLIKI